MRIEGSNRRLSLHWMSLAKGNANFSIVASAPSKYASRRRVGVYAMNPETRLLFLRCTADGKRFLMTTNSEVSEGESAPVAVVLNWAEGVKK